MANSKKGNFGEGSVSEWILKLSLPIMAAEIVHVLYNIVDRIFIGHLPEVGTAAITGVGIAFPLITFIGAFANFAVMGGTTLCSIARGEGNDEKAQRIIETSFTFCLAVGALLTVIFSIFCRPVLGLLGGDAETLPFAVDYFRIYVIGTIPVLISLGMNNFISAQGYPTIGMFSVIIGAGLNTILDPILMYACHMGIRGAAIATVISQTASAVWIVLFLTGKKAIVPIKHLLLDFDLLKDILKLGLTGFLFKSTTSITQAVVNMTLKAFGGAASTLYVGSMSLINSAREIATIPISGLSNGYSPVASFNYGAKKWDRLDKSMSVAFRFSLGLSVGFWALLLLFPRPLIMLFSSDSALIETAIPCFRIYFIFYLFMGLQTMGQQTFVCLNFSKYAIFFSLLRKIFLILPFTLILPRIGLGVMGVFWAEAISNIVGANATFLTMYKVVWKKVKRLAAGDTTVELKSQPRKR